ncbi:MAG: hypothetical protein MRK02_13740 [Candidatus Scalindua sp.]|nr:hypothetical protein [Candidatus Scalindua sp.]
MEVTLDEKKLYQLVKKAVSEVMDEKLKNLKLEMISYAEEKEMEEMKEIFETPEKYKNQEYVEHDL